MSDQDLLTELESMRTSINQLVRQVDLLRHHVIDGNGDSILTRLRLLEQTIKNNTDYRRWVLPIALSVVSLGIAGFSLLK